MESWLQSLRAENIPISFLIGIPNFYERWAYHYAAPDHANHFLAASRGVLERAAETGGTVRAADPDRDVPAITELVAAELADIPGSPVLDEAMLRYFLARANVHGVAWRVIEAGDTIVAVVRHKRWDGGIGPQAAGAVSLVAARSEARPVVAALLLEHLRAGEQNTLPLAIAPHSPFAEWLYLRGAGRTCDRSIFPGGYAAMYRINDLAAVLAALRSCWDDADLISRFAGHAVTLRTGPDPAQVATIAMSPNSVEVESGPGGIEIDAPPAVTVPWVTGWRSAADWLDATPYPPLPGPAIDPGDPTALPPEIRDLLRALFPQRHPYIGDTIQGA